MTKALNLRMKTSCVAAASNLVVLRIIALGRIHAKKPIARAATPHFYILLKLLPLLILHLPLLLLQLLSLPLHSVLLLAMAMLTLLPTTEAPFPLFQ